MSIDPGPALRLARLDDIAALARIQRDADTRFLAVGHPELADGDAIPDDVARRAIAEGRIVVAEVEGAVAGWVYMGRVDGEPCLGQLSVAVAQGRRGVGSALVRAVIEQARAADEASVVLNTQGDVAWNRAWFERFGFAVVARDAASDALRSIERAQTSGGLDWTTRVHMRLTLR